MNPFICNPPTGDTPIIVALDFNNQKDTINLISQLNPSLCKLKVGKELFTACGPKLVEKLIISGYDVFLDLKFHDIPNTVYKACQSAASMGVWMVNVHASGGENMLLQAREAINNSSHHPLLIAVTVLTSITQPDLPAIGIDLPLREYAIKLAKLSAKCELDGVVCSAAEAKMIKQHTHEDFLTITPGIRLTSQSHDDQKRIMTPREALDNSANYLVIGRPITQSDKPYDTIIDIISSIS